MSSLLDDLAGDLGIGWMDHQSEAFAGIAAQAVPVRACLYYKTGAGKTITGLVAMRQSGVRSVLVVTPPRTYPAWQAVAEKLGMIIACISHAKFRQKTFRVSRTQALIVDEFHLLGGHGGQGWKKLDAMARGLQAPLIIMSATPNYNDAERVYCIQHVLDPHSVKGGYVEFLYRECNTVPNNFGITPLVDEDEPFRNYGSASEYLAALPYVYYLPDDVVYQIEDHPFQMFREPAFETYGYDRYTHRMMASIIEAKHRRIFNHFIDPNGYLNDEVYEELERIQFRSDTPTLVFANHSTVAEAYAKSLYDAGVKHALVTGSTPAKKADAYIAAFKDGVLDVLVGTATLATGTDGLDKVCDQLIILDDTEDPSLRRQVIGRILPRGMDTDASRKRIHRILLT